MKTLKIFFIILIISTGFANAQFTKAELQVSGLTCALCSKATERSLKTLPFVGDIKTDLMRNIYVLTFKFNVPVNFDQISKKVKDAGFFVNSLKASFNFDNLKLTGNKFNFGDDTYQLMNGTENLLNGIITLTVVDNGFAPKSVSRKYLGRATVIATQKNGRLYHMTI